MSKTDTLQFRRHLRSSAAKIRAEGAEKPTLIGYAARFYDPSDAGTEYWLWENQLVERIMPGAFDRAVKEDDVLALFNHNEDAVLGRTESKTLRLSVDKMGLKYEISPPDTQVGRDVTELVRRGDLGGSSFAFIPSDITNRIEDGVEVVEIRGVKLYDVSVVGRPAYAATSVDLERKTTEMRSYLAHLERFRAEKVTERSYEYPFGDPETLELEAYFSQKALEEQERIIRAKKMT